MPVYFIAEDESGDYENLRIKIGMSKDIMKRIGQLQTGSPYVLKLMGWIKSGDDKKLERRLHKKYQYAKSHGEWFILSVSNILTELKACSTQSHIAVNGNAFEVVSYDTDAIPEFYSAWKWHDVGHDEFCPACGWGGGLSLNENYGGERCLNCGACYEFR